MTCSVEKQCDNYKEHNFCPIKRGDTFPETSIRVFKRDDVGVETLLMSLISAAYAS